MGNVVVSVAGLYGMMFLRLDVGDTVGIYVSFIADMVGVFVSIFDWDRGDIVGWIVGDRLGVIDVIFIGYIVGISDGQLVVFLAGAIVDVMEQGSGGDIVGQSEGVILVTSVATIVGDNIDTIEAILELYVSAFVGEIVSTYHCAFGDANGSDIFDCIWNKWNSSIFCNGNSWITWR